MGDIGPYRHRYDVLPVPAVSLHHAGPWTAPARRTVAAMMTVPAPEPLPVPHPEPVPEPSPIPGPEPAPQPPAEAVHPLRRFARTLLTG